MKKNVSKVIYIIWLLWNISSTVVPPDDTVTDDTIENRLSLRLSSFGLGTTT